MRKGFDSLGGMVMQQMQLNALSGAVFIFFNKKRNQVKLLHREGDGFAVYYNRLEKGTYEFPKQHGAANSMSISSEQLRKPPSKPVSLGGLHLKDKLHWVILVI